LSNRRENRLAFAVVFMQQFPMGAGRIFRRLD